jgi:hypothetical protein
MQHIQTLLRLREVALGGFAGDEIVRLRDACAPQPGGEEQETSQRTHHVKC